MTSSLVGWGVTKWDRPRSSSFGVSVPPVCTKLKWFHWFCLVLHACSKQSNRNWGFPGWFFLGVKEWLTTLVVAVILPIVRLMLVAVVLGSSVLPDSWQVGHSQFNTAEGTKPQLQETGGVWAPVRHSRPQFVAFPSLSSSLNVEEALSAKSSILVDCVFLPTLLLDVRKCSSLLPTYRRGCGGLPPPVEPQTRNRPPQKKERWAPAPQRKHKKTNCLQCLLLLLS